VDFDPPALGLTQLELAARPRGRRAMVSRIENAHVTGIDFDVLERLAGVVGVESGMLISRTAAAVRPPRLAAAAVARLT
jgi:transcriptional regulator with XRE-family HTH domain